MATRKTKAADAELDAVKDTAELDPIAAAVKAVGEPSPSGELAVLTSGGLVDPGQKVLRQSDVDRLQAEIDYLMSQIYFLRDPSAVIRSGDDLHDFKTPGRYACNTGSIAQGVLNSPYKASGYRLDVIETTGNNLILMLYPNSLSLANGCYYMCTYTASSNTWSDWYTYQGTTD